MAIQSEIAEAPKAPVLPGFHMSIKTYDDLRDCFRLFHLDIISKYELICAIYIWQLNGAIL